MKVHCSTTITLSVISPILPVDQVTKRNRKIHAHGVPSTHSIFQMVQRLSKQVLECSVRGIYIFRVIRQNLLLYR